MARAVRTRSERRPHGGRIGAACVGMLHVPSVCRKGGRRVPLLKRRGKCLGAFPVRPVPGRHGPRPRLSTSSGLSPCCSTNIISVRVTPPAYRVECRQRPTKVSIQSEPSRWPVMLDPSSTNGCPTTTRQMLAKLHPRTRTGRNGAVGSYGLVSSFHAAATAPDPEEALPADVAVAELTVTSDAFDEGGQIPQKYTCDGEDISPDLKWNTPPAGSRSIAVIFDDPDAPGGTFIHWTVLDLPAEIRGLGERVGNAPSLPEGALHGQNGFGE